MKNKIAVLFVIALLQACSSSGISTLNDLGLSCQEGDWSKLGYKVAFDGQAVRKFNDLAEVCGKSISKTARSTFQKGYAEGIKKYCTYDNGYKLAESGKSNKQICPLELRKDFEHGYLAAYKIIEAHKEQQKRLSEYDNKQEQGSSAGAGRD